MMLEDQKDLVVPMGTQDEAEKTEQEQREHEESMKILEQERIPNPEIVLNFTGFN